MFCVLLRRRVVSVLLGFYCHEMRLHWFLTVNSPVILLKYTFEFVLNTARSAKNGDCRTEKALNKDFFPKLRNHPR